MHSNFSQNGKNQTDSPYSKDYSGFGKDGGKMTSDMFNFDTKIKNISSFSNDSKIETKSKFNHLNVHTGQNHDETLPLKSKDISIIFDPEAEVQAKKI
jgi:hypothetical protein